MTDVKVHRFYEPNGGPNREGWYVAFIDEMGFVSIQSDWGDYAYGWHSRGEGVGILEFLLDCDNSYLLSKFAPTKIYDEDATRAAVREAINEAALNADQNQDEMDHFGDSDFSNEIGFADWCRDTQVIEPQQHYRTQTHPQALAFMEHVWPRLCAKMQAVLDEERRWQAYFNKEVVE